MAVNVAINVNTGPKEGSHFYMVLDVGKGSKGEILHELLIDGIPVENYKDVKYPQIQEFLEGKVKEGDRYWEMGWKREPMLAKEYIELREEIKRQDAEGQMGSDEARG